MQRLDFGTPDLAHILEDIEAEVWLDWISAATPSFVERLGIGARRVGGAVAGVTAGTDVLMYNRVVNLGMAERVSNDHVDELIAFYSAAGASRWMVQWCPAAQPPGTVDLLGACGLRHHNNWAKLYRLVDMPLHEARTSLRIERVGGEQRDAFADVLSTAFEHERPLAEWSASLVDRPGWRAYMAFDGERAVATGALFVHGRSAWIGFGATRPEFRGRGAQTALTTMRIRAARDAGCETIVAETAEDLPDRPVQSFRNLKRLGFQLAYLRPNYVMIPGTPAAGVVAERRLGM